MMLHQAPWQKRLDNLAENHGHCHFGLITLAPLITSLIPAAAAPIVAGVTAADIGSGVLLGAAGGAALGGLTGGNPLTGALTGGLTGGVGAFGPALGTATGIGTVGGDILAGVGGGVLGAELTGGNPLTGALTGGAGGALSGILSGPSTAATSTTMGSAVAPAGAGAATTAVPQGAGSAPGTAAALGDIMAPSIADTSLLAGPATTGTGMSGNLLAGPATTGGSPGTVSSTSSPSPGPVSGTSMGSSGTFGGNLPTWATPSAISTGWSETAAAGGSPLAPDASFGSKLLSGVEGDIGKLVSNPVGLLAGGLLLSQMFGGQKDAEKATMDQLQQQAASAASTATMLQAPLRSGVLPPGAQASLDLARSNAQASTRSAYAGMGMGGSTGEADAFQAIAENIAAQKVGIEDLLFSQAGPYAQLASTDYTNILNEQRAQDQQFTGALMNFVAALSGSKAGTTTSA